MKWVVEKDLSEFPFETSQARETARFLTKDQFDKVERELELLYPEGMTENDIEDYFRFEFEEVFKMAGLRTMKVTAEDGATTYVNVNNEEEKREVLGCFDAEELKEYNENVELYDYDDLLDWAEAHGRYGKLDLGDEEEQQAEVHSRGWAR